MGDLVQIQQCPNKKTALPPEGGRFMWWTLLDLNQ